MTRTATVASVETEAPESPKRARRITYVVSRWGERTQTFVRREAASVRAAGVDVSVLSLRRPVADSACGAKYLPPCAVHDACATIVDHPGRVARLSHCS